MYILFTTLISHVILHRIYVDDVIRRNTVVKVLVNCVGKYSTLNSVVTPVFSCSERTQTNTRVTVSKTRNVIMRSRHRSKKRKIKNESQVTSETRRCVDEDSVPRELVFEILLRFPSKSIARFLFVSKLWATIIRSRYFIKTFASRTSLLQPRLLFAFKNSEYKNEQNMWNFFSSSSTPTKESPTYLSLTRCSIPNRSSSDKYINKVPRYVNGLISVGPAEKQIICNPSTGNSITLPKLKSTEESFQSFFGYDPVDDHYKVLCMSSQESEHQVFTLGGVNKSWRMIEYNILHTPKTNGVCINGVVYYVACTSGSKGEWCLARFDVRSEKFDQLVKFLGDPSRPPMGDPSSIL